MRDEHTREVIKGDTGTTYGFESVWFFVYSGQGWLLHGIEEGSTSLSWASAKNQIDTSYLDAIRAQRKQQRAQEEGLPARTRRGSETAALDPETDPPAAKPKQRLVSEPANDDE